MSTIAERIGRLSPVKRALLALEAPSLFGTAPEQAEPIAVIGMGLRFPGGADSPESFWQVLRDGVDAVSEVKPSRWDRDAFYDPSADAPGKAYTAAAGFLEDVEHFDARFFGILPQEAERMDPQHRLLLEVTWEALEHAGQAPGRLAGARVGVFMACGQSAYAELLRTDARDIDPFTGTGNLMSFGAGRISYFLGLRGPCVMLDTACSASLVAIHLACQSLHAGECVMALAGGVNVILTPDGHIALSRMRAIGSDGRCKTFDAAADGYGRGEGCGVVLLKRLSDALAARDNVLAILRGSATNHDGRSSGLTVPSGEAQRTLLQDALVKAGIAPAEVDYVEAHGTGTSLGDPIEVRALADVLREGRPRERPLLIGSVKTNIAHLEQAAGVAGLIKVVLSLHQEIIPPHLHFRTMNPEIRVEGISVVIPAEGTPWPRRERPRIAGVSSFGMSGTNAHVLVQEAPLRAEEPVAAAVERPLHVLCLSASTRAALKALAGRYERYLGGEPASIGDVCFTASTGRSHFTHRLAVVGGSAGAMLERLSAFTQDKRAPDVLEGRVDRSTPRKIAFLFTGQGSQYVGMGRELFDTQPTFRAAMERCEEILRPLLPRPLLSVLYPSEDEATAAALLGSTALTQPALFALGYALSELWRSFGITPAAVMGHSVGEITAACIAGVIGLEDGLRFIAERARLMQELPAGGAMAAVLGDEELVTPALQRWSGDIALAAVNGPRNRVISGEQGVVDAALDSLEAEGADVRSLKVSHAFHSRLMDPMLDALERAASTMRFEAPRIPVISNLTGKVLDSAPTAAYLRRHARETVQFAQGMATLVELGCNGFIEIGPNPTLLDLGARCAAGRGDEAWLPSLKRSQPDWQILLRSVAALEVEGASIDWEGFDRGYARSRVPLPTYPFERKRHWLASPVRGHRPSARGSTETAGLNEQHARKVLNMFVDVSE